MKNKRRFIADNRGISSLFIGIYVALLALILISTLFIGLSISHSSLVSTLRVEQDRMQESILIRGPNCINISSTTNAITSLIVNNTGSITTRIRSIYIDGKFICDPSTFIGDSYIASQSSLSIKLSTINPPIYLNTTTLNAVWTVTTERGTESSDIGANLWIGPIGHQFDPNKFYFGPLLLVFNMFHWSSDGGNTWHSGWTIPSGTSNVIWRILVADIDDRQLILSSKSSFALVQNSDQSNKIATWDIGPSNLNPPNLTLKPGQYNFLYFSLNGGNINNLLVPNPISSNFLTVVGNFVEHDGSQTPFGQTIPFEAVLVTP
jgi:hypothetical protein